MWKLNSFMKHKFKISIVSAAAVFGLQSNDAPTGRYICFICKTLSKNIISQ